MQRFRPTSRPETLSHKALDDLEQRRFMPPGGRRIVFQRAACMGMDEDARAVLKRVLAMAESRRLGVVGQFMPDAGVSALLAAKGVVENIEEADFFRFQKVLLPYCGVSIRERRAWEEAGVALEDFTAPQVRRAQVALGLLRIEGAQGLVIGRHDDPETLALAGGSPGTRIIEDTTDTARLAFSAAFGVVCQTTLSPRRVSWLVQQLRFRYRDARVSFLDTGCAAMARREVALERLLPACDRVLIVGRPGEASCDALLEAASRQGRPAMIVESPADLGPGDFEGEARILLTAGAFALDETILAVAGALGG